MAASRSVEINLDNFLERNQMKLMSFEEIWRVVEIFLKRLYQFEHRLSCVDYMKFYTIIYNYCLKSLDDLNNQTSNNINRSDGRVRPANAGGSERTSLLSTVPILVEGNLVMGNPPPPPPPPPPASSASPNNLNNLAEANGAGQGVLVNPNRRNYEQSNEAANIALMYRMIDEFLKEHTKLIYTRIAPYMGYDENENQVEEALNENNTTIIGRVASEWTSFKNSTNTLNGIFDYMNRLIVLQKQKGLFDDDYHTINLVALVNWRENVLLKLNDLILPLIFDCIEHDRWGWPVDRQVLKVMVGCYVDLSFNEKQPLFTRSSYFPNSDNSVRSMSQSSSFFASIGTNTSYSNNRIISDDWEQSIYRRHFEYRFLTETQQFYRKESTLIINTHSFAHYVDYVKRRLKEEIERVDMGVEDSNASNSNYINGSQFHAYNCSVPYIHESSAVPLRNLCMAAFVDDHIDVIKQEAELLLKNDDFAALKSVYELLRQSPNCIEELKQLLSRYIENYGIETILLACQPPSGPSDPNEDSDQTESIDSDDCCIVQMDTTEVHASVVPPPNANAIQSSRSTIHVTEEMPCCSQNLPTNDETAAQAANAYTINAITFVETIIEIYLKYETMVGKYLYNDSKFINALQIGCVNFMKNHKIVNNPKNTKPVTTVAIYFNTLLSKAMIYQHDPEYEEKITKAFIVFMLIEDKDLFQKYYIDYLAARLLSPRMKNMDTENFVLNKFKEICGVEFTSQMQKMLRDMESSTVMNYQFHEYMEQIEMVSYPRFALKILSYGSWPLEKETDCDLPLEFKDILTQVENFYFSKYSGRKLIWLYLTSRVSLRFTGTSGKFIFKANLLQAVVLMLFNNTITRTFEELLETTKIAKPILIQILVILCEAQIINSINVQQHQHHRHYPVGENISMDGAIFEVNVHFRSLKKTINVFNKYVKKEEPKEDPKPRNIKDERRYVLEAAIVRIMKARVKLAHSALVAEIMAQLSSRFKPQIKLIKTCIESLLDKEYIARDEVEESTYRYLA